MMMITNELARRNNNKKKQFERFPKVVLVDLKFLNFFLFERKRNSQIPSAAQV
jgi:hypothetical protein